MDLHDPVCEIARNTILIVVLCKIPSAISYYEPFIASNIQITSPSIIIVSVMQFA